jgi:hypothetical protein
MAVIDDGQCGFVHGCGGIKQPGLLAALAAMAIDHIAQGPLRDITHRAAKASAMVFHSILRLLRQILGKTNCRIVRLATMFRIDPN